MSKLNRRSLATLRKLLFLVDGNSSKELRELQSEVDNFVCLNPDTHKLLY